MPDFANVVVVAKEHAVVDHNACACAVVYADKDRVVVVFACAEIVFSQSEARGKPGRVRPWAIGRLGMAKALLAMLAIIFALNQIVTALTGRPPRVAVLMMLISTGMVLGNNLLTIIRAGFIRLVSAGGSHG